MLSSNVHATHRRHLPVSDHCPPPVDLLSAALGDCRGLGMLNCDHDSCLVAEKADLTFDSVLLAARGTL
jgi:hypothetical protein